MPPVEPHRDPAGAGGPAAAAGRSRRVSGRRRRLWSAVVGAIALLAPGAASALGGQQAAEAEEVAATPQIDEKRADALAAQRAAELRTEQAQANLEAVREILDIGLAGDEAGRLLSEARRRAPDPVAVLARVSARERELAEARLNRVRLLEERRLSADPREIARLTEEVTKQAAYLAALEGALSAERALSVEANELIRLLDTQLLWIASAPPIGRAWGSAVLEGARWLGGAQSWRDVRRALAQGVKESPFLIGLLLLVIVALILGRRRLVGKLPILAANIGRYASDSFMATIGALVVTLLLSLAVPLTLAALGGLLLATDPVGFVGVLGKGLIASGAVYLFLDFFRQMSRSKGLAEAHFTWNDRARKTLVRNLRWLLPVEVCSTLVVATTEASNSSLYRQGLGRLAFMIGALGIALFIARVFRPESGVFSEIMSHKGWGWRLRRLLYGALVLLPASLVVAAACGYYYTASEVQGRLFVTGLIVISGVVVYSLLKRWSLVARRRVAVKQARERLALQREAKKQSADDAASGEAVPDLDPTSIDVTEASAQTLALLRTSVTAGVFVLLWGVWREILPALTVLERIELTDPALDATGAVLVAPVTAWALLCVILTVVLTFAAARNLPAALELAILQRLSLDHGARYAATTLARYTVVIVGVLVTSHLVGIDWSRLQWIIAALGVGLGFGLQEIVANFMSGLIILFERPIRVGDTVTVGQDSGTVSRLRIRATTITDWDNKEILVPNKSFITDRVVNWTLSSPVTRLLLRVGVAYGTDETLAQRVISDAVRSVPAVLDEPAFSVLFVGFGESSLDFEVRVFVPDLSKRLPTVHEMHVAINRALKAAGIEIPFPQRDLHLRTKLADVAEVADIVEERDDAAGS